MKKKKLIITFSGGETSAFMAQWILNNKKDEFEIICVFANTGQENEETLDFVEKCDKEFNLNLVWVEAVVNPKFGEGVRHRIVDYKTASRNGQPFEDLISKMGMPNQSAPFCTRDLKLNPIKSYLRSIKWKNYWTAIGIRADEFDRINPNRLKERIYYPLVSDIQMTKPMVNFWWNQQPFRLNLKGYQGNVCFYCGEHIDDSDIHVDHVLPRQVIRHDEIWNLVLSHSLCNLHKDDFLVGKHYLEKLILRNENIMGSNHPWKKKISETLGATKNERIKTTLKHYDDVKVVLNNRYWENSPSYNRETDPFYKRLITVINNR